MPNYSIGWKGCIANSVRIFPMQSSFWFLHFIWLFFVFNWRIIALQCVGFCYTIMCISYKYIHSPSLWSLPSHPIWLLTFIAEHWAELPVWHSSFPLATCSTPGSAYMGLPRRRSGKEPSCKFRRCGLDPWAGKIPWRRKWQPTPVLLSGKSHGQRSLAGYHPQGHKESDTTQRLKNNKVSICQHHYPICPTLSFPCAVHKFILYISVSICALQIGSSVPLLNTYAFRAVQFSRSVVSNSLQPHELQHARPPYPIFEFLFLTYFTLYNRL